MISVLTSTLTTPMFLLQMNRVKHEIGNTGIARRKKHNKLFLCKIHARGEILPSFIVLSLSLSLSLSFSISCGQWEGCSKMTLPNILCRVCLCVFVKGNRSCKTPNNGEHDN